MKVGFLEVEMRLFATCNTWIIAWSDPSLNAVLTEKWNEFKKMKTKKKNKEIEKKTTTHLKN